VKPGQTMQPAGALLLQPTLCPWMKRSGRLLSSDSQSLNRHPATIYRWIDAHDHSERVSVLLRKGRSDQGGSRLSQEVDAIIEAAIKKIYLVAEQPQITAVIEEVELQCFKAKLKKPGANTLRSRQLRKQPRPLADHSQPVRDTNKPVS
jgi:putative transposase